MTDVIGAARRKVEITGNAARVMEDGIVSRELEIKELPDNFREWQLDYKRRIYDAIAKDEYIAFNAGHLPVVGTWDDEEGLVPNLANKGVGFTPKDEFMDHYVQLVEGRGGQDPRAAAPRRGRDARAAHQHGARVLRASRAHRLAAAGPARDLRGETYRNLTRRPLASVLWTGQSPIS